MARQTLAAASITALMVVTLVGCSGTSTDSSTSNAPTDVSTVAASTAVSPGSASGDPMPPTPTVVPSTAPADDLAARPTPTDAASWCDAYGTLAERLSGAAASPERATAGLAAIDPINQLMATGVDLGFFTAAELAANQRLFAAYRDVLTLAAQGSTEDSEDMSSAREELAKVSSKEGAGIASANAKLRELCMAPRPSASPSSS